MAKEPAYGDPVGTAGHMQNLLFPGPQRMYRALALVDTGAERALIYGDAERVRGPITAIDGYRGQSPWVRAVTLTVGIGRLPPRPPKGCVSPLPEYVLGIGILVGMRLQTAVGAFSSK